MNPNVHELTNDNWEAEVLQSNEPVLVDFWAAWCAPCRAVAPVVEALADQYAGRARVGKVNVDDHGDLAARYGIRSIPTLLVFRDGEVVEQRVGAAPQALLAELLDQQLAGAATG